MRSFSALKVFYVIALYKSTFTYLLTYSPTSRNRQSKIALTDNRPVKIDQMVHNSAAHWSIMLKCPDQIWCS